MQSGRLKPGHRLPSQRQLANEPGVHLTTVPHALNEVRGMGPTEATTGRRSYVRGKTFGQDNTALPGSPVST
ncbi:GntR family transcriptional regulator [Microvirga makkahensis]|uniref:GntR family transcriptional regulator n=1 Tax=Microvirga makkahensis TaxID=1128670 RepID=A0A7X3MSX8_9HYPH|nr:GntR family transcriptional regulator [Microvirga makkahensis]